MKQDNTNSTPLWRELNEKRTQGNWEVASSEPGDEYSLNVLAPINMAGDKRTVVMANPNLYFMDRAEQNAQYTALAVNNLHKLAEALEVAKKELRFLNVNEDGSQKANTPVSRVLSQIETALAAIS